MKRATRLLANIAGRKAPKPLAPPGFNDYLLDELSKLAPDADKYEVVRAMNRAAKREDPTITHTDDEVIAFYKEQGWIDAE